MVSSIIAAAGQGKRMGGEAGKQLLMLNGMTILERSIRVLSACRQIEQFVIVTEPSQVAMIDSLVSGIKLDRPFTVVGGGKERQYSVANALKAVSSEAEYILVHDGARPLVLAKQIEEVIEAAKLFGAAALAAPVKDTIKLVDKSGFVAETPERSALWAIHTPQVFEAKLLRHAYAKAEADGFLGTDDASLAERLGAQIKLINGGYENIKITTPEDLYFAQALLAVREG